MSSVRRIAKNTIVLYAARTTSTLLKFFLFICIARILGDVTLGKFTFAIVFTTFFSIIIILGMDDLFIREVARNKSSASKYLGNVAILRIILSIIAFALIAVVINIMDYPTDTRLAVYIFGGYAIFTSLSSLFRANFRANERMEWDSLLEILESVTTTSVGFFLLLKGYGLIEVSLVFLFASLVNLILGFTICTRKFARTRFEFDFKFWKATLKLALPFSVSTLFVLYTRVDTIILSAMKGDAVVGYYNAAYQIVLAFDPLTIAFMGAVVPIISRYFVSSQVMLQLAYEKSVKYLVIVGFPLSVGGMVLADKIIYFLYGAQFSNSIVALQILIWNGVLICMNRPMLFMLGAINRQGTSAIISLMAIAVSMGLNFLLVPRWSYIGSGITTLITATLLTTASWYAIAKYACRLSIGKIILKPTVASLIMGAVIYLGSSRTGANLFVLVALGIATYFTVLYFIKGLSMDDQNLFREAMRIGRRVS